MHDWLKKNQKKLLAVFGAFLMVSFLISGSVEKISSFRPTRGTPVAYIGKTPIYNDEKRQIEAEFHAVTQHVGFQMLQYLIGRSMTIQLVEHQDMFLLLIKEAEARGIDVSMDVARTYIANDIRQVRPDLAELENDQTWQGAIRHLLMLQLLRNQLQSDSKFSEADWKQTRATRERTVRLNLVEFNAGQMSHSTTQPTTQQVQAVYEAFKNVPDTGDKSTDTLAFGYQVPNRVKLQYLTVRRTDVLKAIQDKHRDAKDVPGQVPYELQVQALIYYNQHLSDFVRVAPESQPTTTPSTAPATAPAGPTTRPIAEVQDEIISKLVKDEADELEKKIADAIQDQLAAGFHDWTATTHPATSPTTTQPIGYASYGFLEGVAAKIDSEFKVLPEVTQVAEWADMAALKALPGIGSAASGELKFASAAMNCTVVGDAAAKGSALQILQPSGIFSDTKENNYLFRLTEASPAHAPELETVLSRVQEDARLKSAYDHANDLAKKFVDRANRENISRAALDSAMPIISTGEFNPGTMTGETGIPNFQAGPSAVAALIAKTKDLLDMATPEKPNPIAIVSMPGEKLVVVAQLADVQMHERDGYGYARRLSQAHPFPPFYDTATENLVSAYLSYDAVSKRLDYKPSDKSGG